MRVGMVLGAVVGVVLALSGPATARQDGQSSEPVGVSVWYRGVPPGVIRQDDLAAIRAYGFEAFTWPNDTSTSIDQARRLGVSVGLTARAGGAMRQLTPRTALRPAASVRIGVGGPSSVTALAWRAIAHGARVIEFDAGEREGAGLVDEDGVVRPWVAPARDIARQLRFNSNLIQALASGPDVRIGAPRPAALDVALLQTPRAWVLIATNTSQEPVRGVVLMPPGVPAALWVDLLDGTEMSMLNSPGGARWTFDLAPDRARVYAIDK